MSNDFNRQKEIGETAEAFVKHHFSFLTQDAGTICLLKDNGQRKIEGSDVKFVPLFPTECETLEKGGKRKFTGYKIDVNDGSWEKAEIKAVGKVLARDNDQKLNKAFKEHGTIGIEIWQQPFENGNNLKQAKWIDKELDHGWLYDFLYPEDRKSKRGVTAAKPDLLIYVLHDEREGKDPFKKPPFAVLCFKWDNLLHRLIRNNILPFPTQDKTKYPRWTDWQGKSWKCQRQPNTNKACMIGNMLHISIKEIIDLASVTMTGDSMPELSPDRQEFGFSRYQYIKKHSYGMTIELSEQDIGLYSE